MGKLLYFTAVEIRVDKLDGVAKKVIAQCRAFEEYLGKDRVFFSAFDGGKYTVRKASSLEEIDSLEFNPLEHRKLRLKTIYPQLLRFVRDNDIDSVYFRSPGLDMFSRRFFRGLQSLGATTIVEIPTWPFWPEKRQQIKEAFSISFMGGIIKVAGALCYWMESRRLDGLIDSVVTFSDVTSIWGLPAIGISNGYDFDSAPKINEAVHNDELRFVTAATLRENHGIDRIIKALANYRGDVPVSFHIAGEGDASSELRGLAKSLGVLDRTVFFHGYLYGSELAALYEESDVGVSALGFHRYGVYDCSPLKTKEYLALGLPCLGTTSEKDILNSEASKYFYAVGSNEDPIPLDSVVAYFSDLKRNGLTRSEVRQAGRAIFDWTVIMKPIAERFDFRSLRRDRYGR